MRRRFFVERFEGQSAVLQGETAHHLGRVLRAEPGQLYELSDGRAVWLGRVEQVGREEVKFSLVEPIAAREPSVRTTLLLAIVKFDRFEWCLEKATELGVAEIIPLAAARSEKALVAAAAKRAERWSKIALESAQQSRRLRPPLLRPTAKAESVGALLAAPTEQSSVRLILSERPDVAPLKSVLEGMSARSACLAIGPEGGWTDEELSAALAAGFREASLGPQILRTETAVIAALAIVNYVLGE